MAKTFSQKPADVSRRWILIDAKDLPLGRLSSEIAKYLIGKYKPTFTPHVDGGDYVVVINAAEVPVTGNKEEAKTYSRKKQRHTTVTVASQVVSKTLA